MEHLDTNKHTFKGNQRGERFLLFITTACAALIGFLVYIILSGSPWSLTLEQTGIAAVLVAFMLVIILTLFSAWKAYHYALDTEIQIDPIRRHFVYTHNGKTVEFNGDDVTEWYDDLGLKIGSGKLTRLTEHDSVLILKSGQVIYLHSWLWEGDHSWFHAGGTWEHNIKFYLEAHREQLHLPECKMAWTYKYMFAK